jgi:hypothetical protein
MKMKSEKNVLTEESLMEASLENVLHVLAFQCGMS